MDYADGNGDARPRQMIRSVMQGMPQAAPGSGMVMTSISSGNGDRAARRSPTAIPANGGRPQVKVSRTGNACGALMSSGPVGVTQKAPAPRQTMPAPVAPRHGRLWTIGYPPHPVASGTPPRT